MWSKEVEGDKGTRGRMMAIVAREKEEEEQIVAAARMDRMCSRGRRGIGILALHGMSPHLYPPLHHPPSASVEDKC